MRHLLEDDLPRNILRRVVESVAGRQRRREEIGAAELPSCLVLEPSALLLLIEGIILLFLVLVVVLAGGVATLLVAEGAPPSTQRPGLALRPPLHEEAALLLLRLA